jgi:hypothetical protein
MPFSLFLLSKLFYDEMLVKNKYQYKRNKLRHSME